MNGRTVRNQQELDPNARADFQAELIFESF